MTVLYRELAIDLNLDGPQRRLVARAHGPRREEVEGASRVRVELAREFQDVFRRYHGALASQREASGSATMDRLEAIGQELTAALFTADVAALYRAARDRLVAGEGLRLRLRMSQDELLALPWELLRDPDKGTFLATSPSIAIVRHPLARVAPLCAGPDQAPLRVVAFGAAPAEHSPVDVEAERRMLEEMFDSLSDPAWVDFVWARGQTAESLREVLHERRCHILHLAAHGVVDSRGRGALVVADERGRARALGAPQIASIYEAHPELRLVVLNACHGAEPGHSRSVASMLLGAGVSAVIAMQGAIRDAAARQFSKTLYERLIAGAPIAAAVAAARHALYFEGDPAFALPVLFLRTTEDAALIRRPAAQAARRGRGQRLAGWLAAGATAAGAAAALWPPLLVPSPLSNAGIVVAAPWLSWGAGRDTAAALCSALEEHGPEETRCIPVRAAGRSDAELAEAARASGASFLVIAERSATARIVPLGSFEAGDVFHGSIEPIDLRSVEQRARLVHALRALTVADASARGIATRRVECPQIDPGEADTVSSLARLVNLLVPDCRPARTDRRILQRHCGGSAVGGDSGWACSVTRASYMEACPACDDAQEAARALATSAAPGGRFQAIAQLWLARRACDLGQLDDAARLLEQLDASPEPCVRMKAAEIAACIMTAQLRAGPGEPSPVDGARLERLVEESAGGCMSPVLRGRMLGLRAWWRGRAGQWDAAASGYDEAWESYADPLYMLNRAAALLRVPGSARPISDALRRLEHADLDPTTAVHDALMRVIASQRLGLPGLSAEADVLVERYSQLPPGQRVFSDASDESFRELVCGAVMGTCIYDILAREKTPELAHRLRDALAAQGLR
ncbi:CHAT domain-containing protein [Sorangium sp. So ce117]|uniref:CHAT domain-containing protein n=1 Tax=Sorangium sp. So ce117 TaxID=3133277 RepID=UPI003F5E2D70